MGIKSACKKAQNRQTRRKIQINEMKCTFCGNMTIFPFPYALRRDVSYVHGIPYTLLISMQKPRFTRVTPVSIPDLYAGWKRTQLS